MNTSLIETMYPKRFSWTNAAVITLSPIAAVIAGVLYIRNVGFHFGDGFAFVVMYLLTGLSITAGYHRYWAHRAFECSRVIQFLMLFFGAAAVENSALSWSSDHRYHHSFTDQEEDPYNINKGFFWAHMGWIYYGYDRERVYVNVNDLKRDPLVMWQHRYYVWIALVAGLVVPYCIGALFGHPWGGVIWGGLVRMVMVHHATFLINSAAHVFGTKPYDGKATASDSWWLAYFSFGEGYHNYHHTHPRDYRNGVLWYQFDVTKWLIWGLSIFGQTWSLRRTALRSGLPNLESSESQAAVAS